MPTETSALAQPGPQVLTASRGALLLAFATLYLVWGSTYLAIRVAVAEVPPFFMAGIRFGAGAVVLLAVLRLRGVPAPTAAEWRREAATGLLTLVGGNGIVCWSEQYVPSGLTCLLLSASPLVLTAIERLRPGGKAPTPGLIAGMLLGVGGVAFLFGPGAFPAGSRPPWFAVGSILVASAFWWGGSLYGKHHPSSSHRLMGAAAQMLVASAGMFLVGLLSGEGPHLHLGAVSSVAWLAVAYLTVLGSLVAYPTYLWLLRHSAPSRVSTYAYVNPLIAVVLGWAVLHEPLTPRIAASAAVIVAAVAVVTLQSGRAS